MMVAYSTYVRTFVLLVVTMNIVTFLFVWQIYDNIMALDEKLQKLLIDKEISRVSIETNVDKKHLDIVRDIGRKGGKQMIYSGRLRLDPGGAPQRIPVAQLRKVNAWLGADTERAVNNDANNNNNNNNKSNNRLGTSDTGSTRQRRDVELDAAGVEIGETADNAYKVVKLAGSNNFRVLKLMQGEGGLGAGAGAGAVAGTGGAVNGTGGAVNGTGGVETTYLPRLAGENVVAMSLWGRDRRYTVGAVRNAELVARYFPGWKLRVYTQTTHDNQMFQSIPADVMTSLRALGVQFEFMDASESKVPPMMWRFLVADDISVDRFIVRDADSRLSARDAAAVWAWEQSGKAFHCVRDHPSHANFPVSGGMWGGKPGKLREILRASWRELMSGNRADYLTDMIFLQNVIWPRVKGHAYCSDSVSCDKWPASHPYPIKRITYEHVGQVYGANELSRPIDIAILKREPENKKCVPP